MQRSMQRSAKGPADPAPAVVISARELDAIRDAATRPVLGGAGETAPHGKLAASARATLAVSVERKQRIQTIDMAKLKARVESGALEEEQIAALVRRKEREVANTDVGKKLRSMEATAEALRVLEAQLEFKRRKEEQERQTEDFHYATLLQRLNAQEAAEAERMRATRASRIETQSGLVEQIGRRRYDRIVEQEVIEQEAEMMKRAAAKAAETAEAAARAKREQARQAALEIAESNRRQTERDRLRREREAEEDRAILAYQLAKAAREEEAERRREEERAEAERITARLRAEQTREADIKAAEDERKARKAYEARVLAERAAEREAAARRAAAREEMLDSLARQVEARRDKEAAERRRDEEQALQFRIQTTQKLIAEREELRARRAAAEEHHAELTLQVRSLHLAREEKRKEPLEERRALQLEAAAEVRVLEQAKAAAAARIAMKTGATSSLVATARALPHQPRRLVT